MKTNEVPIMLRLPRPQGLTLSIRRSQRSSSHPQNKIVKEIYKTIIRNYIQNGLCINGYVLTTIQLQDYLSLTNKQLTTYIGLVTQELGKLMNPNAIQESYRALLFSVLKSSMWDRHQTLAQVEILKASQVDAKGRQCYKPYISSTLNDAIRGMMQSTNQQMALLAKLSTGPTTAIQNNFYPGEKQGQYMGTEEAVNLIEKRLGVGTEHIPVEDLYSEHKLDECPNVKAELGQEQMIILNPTNATKQIKEHTDKRMKDEGIEDAEDMK